MSEDVICAASIATALSLWLEPKSSKVTWTVSSMRLGGSHSQTIKKILHVLPQGFVLDGQDGIRSPIGMAGARLAVHVHIVTTATPPAQNVIKCCKRAGLHVEDLVAQPLAATEGVLGDDEKELGVALVDIGAGTTDVIVFHEKTVKHKRRPSRSAAIMLATTSPPA